jgi:hypothetical protein
MFFMMRGTKDRQTDQSPAAQEQELAQLRSEIAALRDTQTPRQDTAVPLAKPTSATR